MRIMCFAVLPVHAIYGEHLAGYHRDSCLIPVGPGERAQRAFRGRGHGF